MFKYSKIVIAGIAGIGGGICVDRCFLNNFNGINKNEQESENELANVKKKSSSSFYKVCNFFVNSLPTISIFRKLNRMYI